MQARFTLVVALVKVRLPVMCIDARHAHCSVRLSNQIRPQRCARVSGDGADRIAALNEADLFVAFGTSGSVYPATGFVSEAQAPASALAESAKALSTCVALRSAKASKLCRNVFPSIAMERDGAAAEALSSFPHVDETPARVRSDRVVAGYRARRCKLALVAAQRPGKLY